MKFKTHNIFRHILSVLALSLHSAFGDIVISGGGLILVEEGGTIQSENLATGGTAFAENVGGPPHTVAKVNNGVFGNSDSWIASTGASFVGINLGTTPVPLGQVAFGRDNLGSFTDRTLGTYTLQYTAVANPDEMTAEVDWTTIGTLDYQSAGGTHFGNPSIRHLFTFTEVMATGFRIKTEGDALAIGIDELELYSPDLVISGGGLALVEEGGSIQGGNLAAGGTAFAQDELGGSHAIAKVNDGVFGNPNSWVGVLGSSFVGINLGSSPVSLGQVSFGRDNLGSFTDRTFGTYTLQYTTVANPDEATTEGNWITIGTLEYHSAGGSNFASPSMRHSFSFTEVMATGFRIKTVADALPIGIDELELYPPATGITIEHPTSTALVSGTSNIIFGSQAIGTPSTAKVFTIRNLGTASFAINGVVTTGGESSDFIVDTGGMSTSVIPPNGSTTFSVIFNPSSSGTRTTTLRVSSNTAIPSFDIGLIGNDVKPPVIAPHANVTVETTNAMGATVTYNPATATDDSGITPALTYSHASGSQFPLGVTTVTVTATDDSGNMSTSTFSVTVNFPPPLLVGEGASFDSGNLAAGGIVFVQDVANGATSTIANLNDGLYGNTNGWIAGSANSFLGINLGATPVPIKRIAFGRDNTDSLQDRWQGTYTLQYTAVADPDETTPDGDWITLGVLDYDMMSGPLFTKPWLRHVYSFPEVQATGFRLKVSATTIFEISIDEIELYGPEPVEPLIGLNQEGGVILSGNLATGGTAFAKDVANGITANIPKLNDGIYGNSNGWIAGSANSFLGINLGATPVPIKRVAFGRDNTDTFGDRWQGTYTLQYTAVANPDETTPDGDWTTLGVLDYDTMSGPHFNKPWLRHVYSIPEVHATGFRIKVSTTTIFEISIDEIELYSPERIISIEHPASTVLTPGSATVSFGTEEAGILTPPKTFTIRNTGDGELGISSVSVVDGNASDFIIDTSGMTNAVPALTGSTSFSVTFDPSDLGTRTTTLRVSSNDGVSPDFDIALTGTTIDTTPPAFAPLPDLSVPIATGTGAIVTFPPAIALDNSGVTPSVSYSNASGSFFSLGVTTVTVTATDASGNTATATFEIRVYLTPKLVQEGGVILSGNLATGGTAFAKDVANGISGNIPKLNDGIYGNPNGWIAESSSSFLGINLGATPVSIKRVAFGRDNTDALGDRWRGIYTLQYTAVANPDETTPNGDWITLGVFDYDTMSGPLFTRPWLRHVYSFPEVQATGFRIKVAASTVFKISIDEIELYGTEPSISIEHPANTALIPGSAGISFGTLEAGNPFPPKTFTIRNTGDGELGISSVSVVDGNASDFIIDTSGMTNTVPALTGSTSFSVTFDPSDLGNRTTTLRVRSNDGTSTDFDIALTGTLIDTTPPVIEAHPDVEVFIASGTTGANVSYAQAIASDNSGVTPTLDYAPVSGSFFPLGDTTVTITATDGAGLMSTSTFTVTVILGLQLVQEGGVIPPGNLATGGTAFAKDVANGISGNIPKLNDGIYGNSNGWIAGSANSFLGINLGATPVPIKRVAFGRDNTDTLQDRWQGTYTLQYTTVVNPDETTPDGNWISVGLLDYDTMSGPLFTKPWLRHVFSFPEVQATGFRIKVSASTIFEISIDEIEIYASEPSISIEQPASTVLVPGSANISYGTLEAGTPIPEKTFTIKNTGAAELVVSSVSVVGGDASDFIIDTSGMATTVPSLTGSTTFNVAFNPSGVGSRTTTLRVSSNDGTEPDFDVVLTGTGVDTTPPVIVPHPDVEVFTASGTGKNVTYAPAMASDNSGVAPTLGYSQVSGSYFHLGDTTVTITATDGVGLMATSAFTVRVSSGPELVQEGGVILPGNLAMGGTAFAQDVANGVTANIPKLNDGLYGNANGWIAGSENSFLGLNLGSTPVPINQIAFGRDNTDTFGDRWQGSYIFQYTTVANSDAATPEGSWVTLPGVFDYDTMSGPLFTKPWLRHVYAIPEVLATGFRIKVSATTIFEISIDEIEIYGRPLNALENWRDLHFGTTLNTGVSADGADFDSDGLANLLEYAFGTLPTAQTSAEERPKSFDASNQLTYTYQRPVGGVSGVTYGVEISENLDDWQPAILDADYTQTFSPNGDGTETVTLTFAGSLTDPKFVRLAISN